MEFMIYYLLTFSVQWITAQYGSYHYNLVDRPSKQSSTYLDPHGNGTSNKAVDRNTGTHFFQGTCSHTASVKEKTWWAVNLENLITVFAVTITNRGDCCGFRLNTFAIYGSTSNFNPFEDTGKQECYKFQGHFEQGVTRTFNCSPPITARFLSIVVPENISLTLCDVKMRAVCPDGTYGEECAYNCSKNCKHPPCDKFTAHGTCPNEECNPGFKGYNCSIECPPGTFGVKCLSACPLNCKAATCHNVDGSCRAGCEDDWTGEKCQKYDCSQQGASNATVTALAVCLALLAALCIGYGIYCLLKRHRSTNNTSNQEKHEPASPQPNTYTSINRQPNTKVEAQYEALSVKHQEERDDVNLYENFSG